MARLFAAAFLHDPIFDWIARPGFGRPFALERFFFWTLKTHAIPLGAAWTGDGIGAVFLPPGAGAAEHSLGEYLRHLFLFARLCGLPRLGRGLSFGRAIEANRPREPHYYLAFFAVAPRLQGSGHGSALMEMLLNLADQKKRPVYLENSNPRNDAFYVRLGFKPRRNIAPYGAPPMMAMWRATRLF
jgi:GNAT superfamily N-acetyltransferase